jgi:hypothetical protein
VRQFRWNQWNLDHATRQGVSVAEAERVVRNASRPYPRDMGDEKWLVEGRGQRDRFVRVIYVIGSDDRMFIIHAMPLTTRRRR